MPSDDPQYYQEHFKLDACFQIDQSDVYWALAYHQFFEGFANLLLSFQLETNRGREIHLKNDRPILFDESSSIDRCWPQHFRKKNAPLLAC